MYDPKPYTVLERKGPSLILQRERRVFMRNVSHARKLHQNTVVQEEDEYEMDVDAQQAPLDQHMDPPGAGDQAVRRSVRVRRAPAHLNDFQL